VGGDWCGSRNADVVAPLYCISAVAFTWRFPGKFRSLCRRHARAAAVPAIVMSAVLGWWGFPWGLLWTPMILFHDLDTGGLPVGSRELADMRTKESLEGGSDLPAAVGLLAGLIVVPIALAIVLLPRLPRALG
jgi:hypothetical protein